MNLKSKARDTSRIYVSLKNRKNGNIPSFSLLPGKDCRPRVRCFLGGCYAQEMAEKYDNIKKSWYFNSKIVRDDLRIFKVQMIAWLGKHLPFYFRIHVGGDFFSVYYLKSWVEIVKLFPETNFSCYTKRSDFDLCNLVPELPNLKLFLSAWDTGTTRFPSWLLDRFPVAHIIPKGQESLVETGVLCPGSCLECKHCYESNEDVFFIKKRYR